MSNAAEIWNLNALCRCCHTDGNYKNLAESFWHENGSEIYSIMLRDTLNIEISRPLLDASYTICDECIISLRDAARFKKQVIACEEKFQEYCKNELISLTNNEDVKIEVEIGTEPKHDIKIKEENPDYEDSEIVTDDFYSFDVKFEEDDGDHEIKKTDKKEIKKVNKKEVKIKPIAGDKKKSLRKMKYFSRNLTMDKEQCLKLISLYGVHTWLWKANDPNYANRELREDAWLNISRDMKAPVSFLKKKMESLMGSFRREKSREKKSRLKGSGRDDVYKSNWFAYNAFAFMSDRNAPRTTQDTMGNNENDANDETVNATQLTQDPSLENNIQVIVNHQQQDENNSTQEQRSRKRSKRLEEETEDLSDETLSETSRIQQSAESQSAPCDSYSAFGQYIGSELRKYDPITLAYVKKDICEVIFQADTGAYQKYTQSYAESMQRPTSQSQIPPSPSITSQNPSDIPPPPPPAL